MHRAILGMLLATVAVPAFAADMPVKAAPYAVQYVDWSGVYVGGAVGGAWGRERLDSDVGLFDDPTLISSQLFGTSAVRLLDRDALIQPPFVMTNCLLTNCNTIKMNGIMAGGFAGVQKQLGSWVIGLEGSWDWLSLKKTLSDSEVHRETVTRTVLVSVGGVPVPTLTTATALVTRTASVTAKIDQIADIRGKVGLTNMFFGPNVLLYGTGGASIAHVQHSLTLTQNVQRITETGAPTGTPRFNDFDAVSGDTRLGWVVGAGLDWKPTSNLVLGVLYRHHEFPKGTVAFNDATNSLGFGTSRLSVDSVQGRASILFPIH